MSRPTPSRTKTSTAGRKKKNRPPAKNPSSPDQQAAAVNGQRRERFLTHILPLIILTFVSLLAYANAWPNNFTWDDAIFGMGNRLTEDSFSDVWHYFTDDVWAAIGAETGIYRPLLLLSVALDTHFFGTWMAGFHLVNIFLHLLVTLLVYGFMRYLLINSGGESPLAGYTALLAALVFAVHPVHTEVVNSIFNRSEMLVSVGMVGAIWWFLKAVDDHPWKAWGLLGPVYLLVMLCRETGIVLPGIAFAFLWITTDGQWQQRLRKCLPVFWLLIPLGIYLGLRAHALDTPVTVEEMATEIPSPRASAKGLPVLGLFFDFSKILPAFSFWFDSIKLMLWPDPILTFHSGSKTNVWVALGSQIVLLVFAFIRLMQKKPGMILGLAFFYLSILPASRIVGERYVGPHLAERYLYMPSIGMTIVLAFGLYWLAQKLSFKAAIIPVLAAVMFMTPVTLARNEDWASTASLAEADYKKRKSSSKLRETLISSLLFKGDSAGAAALCDEHADAFRRSWYMAGTCGQVYAGLKRFDDSEKAFLSATKSGTGEAAAHYGLAVLYLRMGRKDEAVEQFDLSVATEKQAFMQEYLAAEKLMRLYPSDRNRLLEARTHLEKCVELQPQFHHGRQRLEELDQMINSVGQRSN